MPLEINEIGVKLAVGGPPETPAGAPAPSGSRAAADSGAALSQTQMQGIVSRCVQRVLAQLRALRAR